MKKTENMSDVLKTVRAVRAKRPPYDEFEARKPRPKRKGKKLPHTPSSRIRAALRLLFLRSREHQAALKKAGRACECCGAKGSEAKGRVVKLEVHHRDGIDWENIFAFVRRTLLCKPERMKVLCKKCHEKEHEETK